MPWFVFDISARDLESLVDCLANATYSARMGPVEKQEVKGVGAYR